MGYHLDSILTFPGNVKIDSSSAGPEFKSQFPGTVNLNSRKSLFFFPLMNHCISSTKIDQKYAPDPMVWVPESEICKECQIWKEILSKISSVVFLLLFLSSYFSVFGILSGKFDIIAFRMQWNRSQGSKQLEKI